MVVEEPKAVTNKRAPERGLSVLVPRAVGSKRPSGVRLNQRRTGLRPMRVAFPAVQVAQFPMFMRDFRTTLPRDYGLTTIALDAAG